MLAAAACLRFDARHETSAPLLGEADDVAAQVDALAMVFVQRRLRDVYSHLASGSRTRANAALALLAAAVDGRPAVAR